MIVVDTNIVIAFLGGEDAIVTRLKEAVAADDQEFTRVKGLEILSW